MRHFLARFHPEAPDGSVVEVNLHAREWVERVSRHLERGWFIIIDYGYTAAGVAASRARNIDELPPASCDRGRARRSWRTRHHRACCLDTAASTRLPNTVGAFDSFETLAHALLGAGERDQFASVLEGCDPAEEQRRRMQLKTLLFGMGETFRVLIASKGR